MSTQARQIFVNLPVKDLKKSIAFFKALGFAFDARFTDDTATCMIIGENIFAMLLTHEKFKTFSPVPIADAHKSAQALFALALADRAAVDTMARKAVEAGGILTQEPEDLGFMYSHGFQDLDGHGWGPFWMDIAAFEKMQKEAKK